MIPILIQICGHNVGFQIEVQVFRSKECEHTDMLNRFGQCQLGQRLTAIESVSAYVGNSFRQRQIGQAFAKTECKVVYVGHLSVAPINSGQLIHALKAMCLHACQSTSLFKSNIL